MTTFFTSSIPGSLLDIRFCFGLRQVGEQEEGMYAAKYFFSKAQQIDQVKSANSINELMNWQSPAFSAYTTLLESL